MAKWLITYTNNIAGCNIEEEFEGMFEEAYTYASQNLESYAEEYMHCAFGWDCEPTEEEWDEYFSNCDWSIDEIAEEED